MKLLTLLLISGALAILLLLSCKKQTSDTLPANQVRKVQFLLYSDSDFSNDNKVITFRASIQNSKSQTLWDSVLAPMKIKEIPDSSHKIIIEKTVPGNNPSLLKVGFYYTIENVGVSWHLDSFRIGETFKILDFNFQ